MGKPEPEESTEEVAAKPENDGIQIHTLETDMADLGIGDGEEKPEAKEGDEKGETPKEKPENKKPRSQRKIEKQVRIIKDKDETISQKDAKIAELEAKIKEEPKKQAKELDLEDFDNVDDYLDAVDKQVETKEGEPAKEPSKPEQEPLYTQDDLDELFADGNEDYKDYDAKVKNKDLVITPLMLSEVLKMDNASDVAYALASDPERAKQIAEIDDIHDLTVAIAQLETIKPNDEAKVPTKTNAPKPITPVNGSSIKGLSIEDDDLSFEQHEALLNSQQNNTRGGFI